MTWVRLDDGFPDHPKLRKAGPLAIVAQVRGLCYCARFLTNGHLPNEILATLFADLAPLIPADMVRARLWHKNGKGFMIHDYLQYNPSRDEVSQVRAARIDAGRRGGYASGEARRQALASRSLEAKSNPGPAPTPNYKTSNSGSRHSASQKTIQKRRDEQLAALAKVTGQTVEALRLEAAKLRAT